MAKGEPLSRHQQKIVGRYYDNKDTIMSTKLAEMVTELYLSESEKKTDSLWKRVETALRQTELKESQYERVLAKRDIEGLAELVKVLNKPR